MKRNIQKYNEWKAIQLLKRYGEYEKYLNEKVVKFYDMGFEHFPKEICYLKKLEELDLESNQINRIPKEISYLKELKELDLYNNQISHIPKEICYLKELGTLDLNDNQIDHIPKEISHLKNNLNELWIQNNPIKQTKKEVREFLPNTEIFCIEDEE